MVTGSGYRKLTHRDFLGSLLGLGLERDVLGDILVTDESGRCAVVLCDETICGFIESELTCVANDKVRVKRVKNDEWEVPVRRTMPIRDTVASPRLDAVVSALCGISREKEREAVVSGLVEFEFESEDRPDKIINAPSVISVRGVGKFKIVSLSDKTKKGRYRLEAEKYI
jgi:RNA-binding protein YlmH